MTLFAVILLSSAGYSQISETEFVKDTVKLKTPENAYYDDYEDVDSKYDDDENSTLTYLSKSMSESNKGIKNKNISRYIPGLTYSAYMPKSDSLGVYHGVGINIIDMNLVFLFHKDIPSFIQFLYGMELMLPLKDNISPILFINFSIRASFESTIQRKNLIPYFEFNYCYSYQSNVPSTGGVTPSAGLWFMIAENYSINAFYGYYLPFDNTEIFAGHKFGFNLNYLFW